MLIHPDIYAALARERSRTFLAEAEAARLSRPLGRPLPRPSEGRPSEGRPVRLRDGSAVLIRPVRPEDARLLEDGFAGLSDRSRRLRFLGPKASLSAAELRYFTNVDHRDHEALGALNHVRGGGVGIARYVRDREEGIRRFTAAVAADNAAMTGVLRNLGADVVGREFGTLEYEMALACVSVRRAS